MVLFSAFYALLLLALLSATRNGGQDPLIWPANAVAVGTYLLFVGQRLGWSTLAVVLATGLVHQLLGDSIVMTLAAAAAAGFSFGLTAWWCESVGLDANARLDVPEMAGLIPIAVVTTVPGALVAGVVSAWTRNAEVGLTVLQYWSSSTAAILLLLPPLLLAPAPVAHTRRRHFRLEMAIASLALATLIAVLAMTQSSLPLDATTCVLLWFAFRLGLRPTALAVAALAISLAVFRLMHLGLPALANDPLALVQLQVRLVLTACPALLIAAITARSAQQQEALEENQRRLSYALEGANDGIWDWHIPSDAIFFSARAYRMLGYTPLDDAPTLSRFRELIHPEDLPIAVQAFRDHAEGRHSLYQCELRGRHRNGAHVWLLARGKIVERNEQGQPVRIVGTITDVSQKKHLEAALEHAASHDPLTGLANRSTFDRAMEQARRRLARDDLPFAVLLVDLDHFKRINDVHGHIAGDLLLTTIARRLQSALRAGDMAARFGGDEFAVVATGKTAEEFAALADRLHAHLSRPVESEGLVLPASISIGMAVATQAMVDLVALVAEADAALYMAKDAGRNTWRALGMLGEGKGSDKVA
ncbi:MULTISPECIES: diguanylate cyclase [unclassified Xanthobacter]|uniref:diguanylate cyclase n=1 Tax=unclassified Xanthobacter TaxID=2623496 RepID=UPI001EDE468C